MEHIFIKMVNVMLVFTLNISLVQRLFIGNWRNNLKEGKGSITLNDGSVFRGIIKFFFLLLLINFQGFFHENKKHGQGTMTRSDGIVYEEEWDQGTLVTQIEKSMGEDTDGKNNKLEDDSFKGETFF